MFGVEPQKINTDLIIRYYYIFYYRPEVGVCTASWDELGHQKTPEMTELEADKYAVQIWAHNFEKQKSSSIFFLGIDIFC